MTQLPNNPMTNFIQGLLGFLIVTSLLLGANSVVFAKETPAAGGAPAGGGAPAASTPITDLQQVIGGTGLGDFVGQPHPSSAVDPGADIITTVIFRIIDFMKYLIGGVAVIYMIISGLKLITSGKKVDEVSEKEKENLKFIIYGLILIVIADELVTKVFFGDYGECIASASNAKECAKVGGGLIKGLYSFVLAMMASIAIFVLVLSAFRLITSAGEEENIAKQKKRIAMAIVGILVAAVGEFAIKEIIFPASGTKGIDAAKAQKLVYSFTNFIAAFIGAASFVMLFYGGYLYVASFGNEEQTGKAKKIIIGAVVGIVIALAAFGIVVTLTSFSPGFNVAPIPGLPGR